MDKVRLHSKRTAVAIIGSIVLIIGLVLVPYPGPGWLIVFGGLAILATEFAWAKRILDKGRGIYHAWQEWLKVQPRVIQAVVWTLTFIVVIVTIWLLNGYGLINDWFQLGWDWVQSPFL